MKQMIEKKNKMLKEAGDDMREIYALARVLRHADAPDELYRKLVQTIVDKIALTSYDYDKYAIECELYLPEAKEDDPESELEALEDDLQFFTPEDGDKE